MINKYILQKKHYRTERAIEVVVVKWSTSIAFYSTNLSLNPVVKSAIVYKMLENKRVGGREWPIKRNRSGPITDANENAV